MVWKRLSRNPTPRVVDQVPEEGDLIAVVTSDADVRERLCSPAHWEFAWDTSAIINGCLRYSPGTLRDFESVRRCG